MESSVSLTLFVRQGRRTWGRVAVVACSLGRLRMRTATSV
jgi:hypothetical protein